MVITISNNIRVKNPTSEMISMCNDRLVVPNPDYAKKIRLGLSTYKCPPQLYLYESDGDTLVLPYGILRHVLELAEHTSDTTIYTDFPSDTYVIYTGKIPLYDYQLQAVDAMSQYMYGILQAPPGSGKTQMGIALIKRLGRRALWLTHTKDLLTQSRERAELYMPRDLMGEITEGKVQIGAGITFATVQTMSRLDLDRYRGIWDVIIVDECHRVSGSPTSVKQFYKVLNALAARHKFGLTATPHRSDGMIKATHALLGEVVYSVPETAVADKVTKVRLQPVHTGLPLPNSAFNSDGTLNYTRYINALAENAERNRQIISKLTTCYGDSCLILSDRVPHLKTLMGLLPAEMRRDAVLITGKSKQTDRALALARMRQGETKYLFATYALAKEGLDIPCLERLFLTTPHTDYAVIAQSIGRIARVFTGKSDPVAYDFVDYDPHSAAYYKKRCTTYRKCGCIMLE